MRVTAALLHWGHILFTSIYEGPSAEGEVEGGKIMKKYVQAVRPGLAFLAVAVLSVAPAMASTRPVKDSEEVFGFLAQAKAEAVELQKSAEEMNSFAPLTTSWQTQAARIEQIKRHVNKLGELVTRMSNAEAPSPWQQQAIREVSSMVEELAANVTMTIFHLNENQDRLIFSSFPEYVAANAELATDIAQLISDYVAYGEAKQDVEELSFELGLPRS
jgi:hypothetical protein